MTVAATTNRKTYTGDNVTTSFATSPVIFYLSSNLQVRITIIATGVSTLLTENTHYTVSGGSTSGATGTVNLAGGSSPHGALISTEKLVILRVLPLTQASDFVNNNNSDAEVLEAALDKLTDVDQQLSERQDRALTFPEGEVSGSTTTLQDASVRAGRLLGFDVLGVLTTFVLQVGTSLVDLAASTGSLLIGFIQAGTGAILRTLQAKSRDIVSLTDYLNNAVPGTTDCTSGFTTALAAANAMWIANGSDQYAEVSVIVPDGLYKAGGGTGIVIPNGVVLVGLGRPKIVAASTGIMFTDSTANSSVSPGYGGGLVNLQLHGLGAGTPLIGLVLNYVQNFRGENLRIENFADQAIKIINGNTNKFRDVISFNCVINTGRAARAGQFEIAGNDHEFLYCEAFNSIATRPSLSSASKFCVGWWLKGTTNRLVGCKGSVTDQGFFLDATSSNNHYIGCRADAIYAEGVYNDGSAALFVDLELLDCGQGTNNTYDVYTATVNTQNNVIASASIFSQGATANKPRYGIADAGNTAGRPNRYNMGAILVFNAQTGMISNSGKVAAFAWPTQACVTETSAARTISDQDFELIANRAGTITLTLPDPVAQTGRPLRVRTIQAQTVVSASANVVPLVGTAAAAAILAATAGKWADLKSDGTNWQIMAGN